jgi:transcriptional regulator with XRE-family HTH domain
MPEIFSPLNIHLHLAKKIRAMRMNRGWSQEVLAELAGLHRNYIGHVERAEVNIGVANLEKIALAFEIEAHELLVREYLDSVDSTPEVKELSAYYLRSCGLL